MATDATVLAVGVTTDGVKEGTGALADLETQAAKTEAATDKFAESINRGMQQAATQITTFNRSAGGISLAAADFDRLGASAKAAIAAATGGMSDASAAATSAASAIKSAGAAAEESSGNQEHLKLATSGVTREFIILGHEMMQGNFSRIPGSIVVMTERMGVLRSLLTATNAVWGGITAVLGLFVLAAIKGAQETQAFNEAIVKSGNISGQTADSMLQLSRSVADTTNTSLSSVKTLVEQLVASGKIGAQSIDEVAQAAAEYSQATGDDLKKVGPEFVKLFGDPVAGAEKLNEQMHFLTVGQLAYIQTLVQTGQADQARLYLADQLIEHLKGQESQLGLLQQAWNFVKEAAGAAWDAMLGVGRPQTPQQAFDAARNRGLLAQDYGTALGTALTPGTSKTDVENAQEMVKLVNQQADAQARIAQQNALEQKLQEGLKNTDNERVKALMNEVDLYNAQRDALARSGADLTSIDQKIADDNKKIQDILNPKQKTTGGLDGMLTAAKNEAARAQDAFLSLSGTLDDKATPAFKRLQDDLNSPAWAKLPQSVRDQITSLLQWADATEKQTAQLEANAKIIASTSKTIDEYSTKLVDQKAKYDDERNSIILFGKANTDSAQAQLTAALAGGQLATALAEQDKQLPGLAAAWTSVLQNEAKSTDAAKLYRDTAAALNTESEKAQATFDKTTDSIEKQAQKLQEQAKNLGLTKEQIDQNKIANDALTLSLDQRALAEAQADVNQLPEVIAGLQARVKADQDLVNAEKAVADRQLVVDTQKAWGSVFDTLVNDGVKFFDTFETKGHDAWKTIADDLIRQIEDALIKLALQQFILNVTANTSLAGAAQQAFGQSVANNPILSLLGNNALTGPGAPLSFLNPSNAFGALATSGVGQALGLSSAVGGSAGIAADAIGGIPGGVAADVGLTGAGSLIASALPFLPVAAIALPFLTSLFGNKNPSPAQGQFQISTGTTGFEDNAYTKSPFGNLGFNDANTQQFSGQGAQVFNQFVATTLQAFQTRLSGAQSQQLATNLQQTSFPTFSGTYTTADFINKYGGQILQQVVTAAFQVLDPALASVAKNFSGTADQVAAFTNSLLAVYDATKQINNANFTKNVDAAMQGADQATADKVVAFVTIVQSFGTAIDGLGTKLEKLDPGSITKFIDALGGAQQAVTTMAYIQQNFTTTADKTSEAQAQLNAAFAAMNIAVPQTHAQFLAILNSFDLTTDAGRQMYAAVAALAPVFVQVAGTADQAAQALAQAAQAGLQAYQQNFLTTAQQNQAAIVADTTALYNATAAGTKLHDALVALGVNVIPTTVAGVNQLVAAITAKYGADSAELQQLYALIPTIISLDQATGTWTGAVSAATAAVTAATSTIITDVGSVIQQADSLATTLVNHFADLANQSAGDFGQRLGIQIGLINDAIKNANPASFTSTLAFTAYVNTLKGQLPQLTSDLTQFTILSAKYGSSQAEQLVQLEDWYTQEQKLFAGNAAALTAAKQVFDQKWQAIINGTTSGVSGTLTQLQTLQQGIAKYLQGLQTSSLSPLSPAQQLSQAQSAYVEDLLKAQGGDQTALGNITTTADAYLKQAQSYYASSGQYAGIFDAVTQQLGHLAGTTAGGMTLPTQTTDQKIATAMPTNGTVASNTDVNNQTNAVVNAIQEAAGEIMKSATTNTTKTGSLVAQGLRRREVTATPR